MEQEIKIPTVLLTTRAVQEVKRLIARDHPGGALLRLEVKAGGCSGHSYHLGFEQEPRPQDEISEADGVKIVVDPQSAPYLQGTVVDFVDSLIGGGFRFVNPKATRTCGCGESFSV